MTLDDLLERYPNAFRYRSKNFAFDRYGFQCGDGWAQILEPIAKYLENANKEHATIWVAQVKEKFGSMRFYVHGVTTAELDSIIGEAENKSQSTCEVCGEDGGSRVIRGYIQTLCELDFKKKDSAF